MTPRRKVLVVGAGSIGARHVRCFQKTGRTDVVLCEINPTLRAQVAAEYQLTATFGDLDEAISAGADCAVICTPANLHVSMAKSLARAGMHLLIEKPLSTSTDGIDDLITLCREQRLVASVAYVYRAHPVFAAMRQAIRAGRFGKPVQVVMTGGQHFPFYRPAYREIYYKDRATGGGAIQDALTHIVNAVEWIVGPITELAADADHQILEGVTVEDTVHVIARHGSIQASYSLNQYQAPNETIITFICEQGTARFEMHRHAWKSQTRPDSDWQLEEERSLERDELFIAQANAFLDAVDGVCLPACPIDEALQTLRVNLAILQAADTHTWQKVAN